MLNSLEPHIQHLKAVLAPLHLTFNAKPGEWHISKGQASVRLKIICNEQTIIHEKGSIALPVDYLVKQPEKAGAIIQSKLGLNQKVFARHCEVKKLKREEAAFFLESYHLMNSTQSSSNYGLFYHGELLAVASFSKGRKMRRLQQNQRSFELIRFCCKKGYTITGGLSKLLTHFVREKKAGDIMTYVDQLWSEGEAFVKAGFKREEKMNPKHFLINRRTFERTLLTDTAQVVDENTYFVIQDNGNLKLIYTPLAKH